MSDIPVDLNVIAQIESAMNPKAVNKATGARGMYQFMPIAWKDVQQNYPQLSSYGYDQAFNPQVAQQFAQKLFELNAKRLGKMANVDNLLASYNFGVGNVKKGVALPKETRDYIAKYKKLLAQNQLEQELRRQVQR